MSNRFGSIIQFFFCCFLCSLARFTSLRRRIWPGPIYRYLFETMLDKCYFLGWWKMVNCAHLIFLNDFYDSIQCIALPNEWTKQSIFTAKSTKCLQWITQFAHVQWNNVFVCRFSFFRQETQIYERCFLHRCDFFRINLIFFRICRQSFPPQKHYSVNQPTSRSSGDKIISTRLVVYQKTCHIATIRCIHRPSTHIMCSFFE